FETRSLPRPPAATCRGFTFYVADPLGSIHELTPIKAGVTRFVTIRVIRVLNRGMSAIKDEPPAIGIIGGSGLYQIEELRDATEHKVDTPFGSPSDVLVGGKLSGRQGYFLPRHGRGHRILPHQINHRGNSVDVIAMKNLAEAKLAREAEIAFTTIAMITDYDCWKVEEEPVSAEIVLSHLLANAETAKKMIVDVIPRIPIEPNWPDHFALDVALVTDRKLWPEATVQKLKPILERFLLPPPCGPSP